MVQIKKPGRAVGGKDGTLQRVAVKSSPAADAADLPKVAPCPISWDQLSGICRILDLRQRETLPIVTKKELDAKATSGDPDALRSLLVMANQGDGDALFYLGRLYDVSDASSIKATTPDPNLSRSYYERAALCGHALAQLCIGNMYDYGDGGEQSHEKARHWYAAAANQGIADAQMHYARMLETGRGGQKNINEAVEWYMKAIEQGDELAATNLGLMHYRGELSESQDNVAFSLFSFSANKLDGLAHHLLGEMHLSGRGTPHHGGMALLHFCIAILLLPDGKNKDIAREQRDRILKVHPDMRESFQDRAMAYISERHGELPT